MTAKTSVLALALGLCLLASGCAGGSASPASGPGPVRWSWHAPRPASVGMPAADGAGVAVTYGHTHVVLLGPGGGVRWEAARLGVREEAPLLTPDLVVVPADEGLLAVERATGRIRWDTRFGQRASTPVLAGTSVVASGAEGSLVAVDLATGAVVWRASLPGRAEGPPATDGHAVAVTWEPEQGAAAGLGVFDATTGAQRWTVGLRAGGVSGPAVVVEGDGSAFVVAVDDDLAAKAFDLATGHRRWTATLGGAGEPEVPPLALPGGRVLVADRLAGLSLFEAGGRRVWSSGADGAATRGGPAGPALANRYVLPMVAGRVRLAGPGARSVTFAAPGGLVNGVAVAPGGRVLVSSAQGPDNQVVAYGPP